jgi:hypothetical protein
MQNFFSGCRGSAQEGVKIGKKQQVKNLTLSSLRILYFCGKFLTHATGSAGF